MNHRAILALKKYFFLWKGEIEMGAYFLPVWQIFIYVSTVMFVGDELKKSNETFD